MEDLDPYCYANWKVLLSHFDIKVEHRPYEDLCCVYLRHKLVNGVSFGATFQYSDDRYERDIYIYEAAKMLADLIFEKCKHNVGEHTNG
jgi:hypothetical protein